MRQRWIVQGTVQGVGFRMWVARHARTLGLSGWVRNLRDGSVEVEAEGDATAMNDLERRVRRGPPHATVRSCTTHAPANDTLPEVFEIRRDT